ncbi:MAG: hypothetical protein ACR2GX_06195 [Candidatus Dormibacteria bacterium]
MAAAVPVEADDDGAVVAAADDAVDDVEAHAEGVGVPEPGLSAPHAARLVNTRAVVRVVIRVFMTASWRPYL